MDKLTNIDWSSWDAGKEAVEIAKEYGVTIDTTTDSWKENIAAMRDAANAVPDLEKINATLTKINDIAKDIELGSILSKEDYEALVDYNDALASYFTILADGSAMFTGDVLDFK
jgi:cyclopropane fatty-acyl-phospholipid synthase-like methyltransferase